ncbi:GRIP1-associated protein 1-like isoform X3 [Salvelinus fontinalis]|uniref:GRIP1-associated protein 1-like isoform X3 n=1 Tax=Salvelinus fontinalis TaxID=8038 RepID=UPI002486C766|nr:GRIP1-associated protein 1-like isoform X3 [Salvelinus fontinalis]
MKEGATSQSINKSASGSPQSQRPADLSDDEVGELFQRLAGVQQEKWMLEEKVKHLEVSCSSMADDICKKSAIIETYVMDSRIGIVYLTLVPLRLRAQRIRLIRTHCFWWTVYLQGGSGHSMVLKSFGERN